ncbi:hypothetical protein BASA61_001256 [Batrachochytrium salamandrivorans]|nr:hypothetical protein BASA61_001256 [Batrachochytrium salamandrivorans]
MHGQPSALAELVASTNFSEDEITRLYKRFIKLDKDGSGSLERDEFLAIPAIASNPLAQRLLAVFDTNGSGDVDFKEFLTGLSAFSAKGKKEDKLHFAFKDAQLQQIVDKTIMEADLDMDGKVSLEEFTKMAESTDIARQMTLDPERF